MGQIPKAFLGIFFFLLTTLAGMGIIMAGVETIAAQDYHADVIEEIESSNFNSSVMEACKEQALAEGYTLTVNPVVYDEDHNIQMAEVVMQYNYSIGILNLSTDKNIRGYAR